MIEKVSNIGDYLFAQERMSLEEINFF